MWQSQESNAGDREPIGMPSCVAQMGYADSSGFCIVMRDILLRNRLRPSLRMRASIGCLLQKKSEVGETGCSQWTNRMLLRHRTTPAPMADRGAPLHREDAMVRRL